LVVLEALASGTPPLAVDTGGLGAVLAEITPRLGELGNLLPLPGDPALLIADLPQRIATVLAWMAEPGRREAAQLSCRFLSVERYSWEPVGATLESLYREAIFSRSLAYQHPGVAVR
jgi:glycosyltransferase involved in cell wall biosynthesis